MSPSLIDVVALVLQADPAALTDASGQVATPGWDSMHQVVLASMLER